MAATTNSTVSPAPSKLNVSVRSVFRGVGQVMFQNSAWTGLFFILGIFWGAYSANMPAVAWGALVGVVASTVAGYIIPGTVSDGEQGLWGFNGVLVGCAFPTFLGCTWQMWVALIICSMATTWVRQGFNNVMAPWKVNSLTFPFVFMTWMFLFASRGLAGMAPDALSTPELVATASGTLDTSFGALVVDWLKGVSQVFLIDSWVTGIFFLVGLALCTPAAAVWAAVASAISLALAILFKANPADIQAGLYGFSPVLTGIALGCTFYKVNVKSALWCVFGIIITFFIQVGMDAVMTPYGLPTLTGPFCIATWLMLLPAFKLDDRNTPDHSFWKKLF